MTTLITGAAGFVGSHLIELLEKDSAHIVALLRPGTAPLYTTIHCDVKCMVDKVGSCARPRNRIRCP